MKIYENFAIFLTGKRFRYNIGMKTIFLFVCAAIPAAPAHA